MGDLNARLNAGTLFLPVGDSRPDVNAGEVGVWVDGAGSPWLFDQAGAQHSFGVVPGDEVLTDTYAASNDAPAMQSQLDSLKARGGGTMFIPRGSHRLKNTVTVDAAQGIQIDGGSRDSTNVIVDDSSGNIGDGFLFKNTHACRLSNFTMRAQSPRTAGHAIHVQGGWAAEPLDALYGLRDSGTVIQDVDMYHQFNGIVIDNDAVNNYQNWRTYVRGGHHRDFSNGGVGVWLNCATEVNKIGASHFVENYYFDVTPPHTAGGALAGIRLTGTGDINLTNNEIYGADYGLLIDPVANGFLTCVNVLGGFYDTANVSCLRIAPNASVNNFGILKFTSAWFGTAFTSHAVHIVGAAAKSIDFTNCDMANALAGWGMVVDAAAHLKVASCNFHSCSTGGLLMTGSASDFIVTDSKFVKKVHTGGIDSLPIGVQIDAGCDHYSVTGNVMREPATPITNTPGLAANRRIVQDNVTA